MTFTAPFTAVPGEIITAAGWNTSARDNINHIWGVIGGNPGTSGLVPHSTGASAGAWGKVTDDLLNDPKVSQIPITITDANSNTGSGFYVMNLGSATNAPFDGYWYLDHIKYASGYYRQIASSITDNNNLWTRVVAASTPSPWVKIWTANNDGVSSGLDADTVRGVSPSNTAGQIAVNNGVLNPNLNAALLTGLSAGNGSGQIPVSNGVANTNLVSSSTTGNAATATSASTLNGFVQGAGAGNIPINNTALNAGLNAQYCAGLSPGNSLSNMAVANGVVVTGLLSDDSTKLGGVLPSGYARFEVITYSGTGANGINLGSIVGVTLTNPKYARLVGVTAGGATVVFDIVSTNAGNNIRSAGPASSNPVQANCTVTRLDNVVGTIKIDAADGSNASGYTYTYIAYR